MLPPGSTTTLTGSVHSTRSPINRKTISQNKKSPTTSPMAVTNEKASFLRLERGFSG